VDDTLALLQPASNSPTPTESRVLLFRPASATPYGTHTIPFRLSNAIWYQTSSRSGFSLVGITDTWSVMLFGDDVESALEDSPTATQIIPDAGLSPRKGTIFQEMFGISALSRPKPATLPSTSSFPPGGGKLSASAIFDAPAYLVPPLESLFEPLMSSFLHPRTEEIAVPNGDDPENEDVGMDVDEVGGNEGPFLVESRPERIVDAQEMNDFVELFKHYGLTSSSTQRNNMPRTHSNGVNKRNGTSQHGQLTTNGAPSTPVHITNGKTTMSTPQKMDVALPVSTPTTAGKKRKKTSGQSQ